MPKYRLLQYQWDTPTAPIYIHYHSISAPYSPPYIPSLIRVVVEHPNDEVSMDALAKGSLCLGAVTWRVRSAGIGRRESSGKQVRKSLRQGEMKKQGYGRELVRSAEREATD